MKKSLLFAGVLAMGLANAQTGKVGINTETPTEIFDVNGTVRVRQLPDENTTGIYTTGTNTASTTANQTFTPTKIVVADANGVLGVSTTQELGNVGGSTATGATTDNNSTAMFVKKRYSAGDWPSGANTNTGFSVDKWDAIITINRFERSGNMDGAWFSKTGNSVQLDVANKGGTWWIIGDIGSVEESWEFTVLFINKKYIASDDTRHAF